jgi:segregation and condensation protein B
VGEGRLEGDYGEALFALLFASGRPVGAERLAQVLGVGVSEVEQALAKLGEELTRRESGVRLSRVAGGYQLEVAPAYRKWAAQLMGDRQERLSPPLMETLAVVAYRQPITAEEVGTWRGVRADRALAALQERGLVQVVRQGETVRYVTTPRFLEVFALASLADLPPWPEEDPDQEEEDAGELGT